MSHEHDSSENKKTQNKTLQIIEHWFRHISHRLLILLAGTVTISAFYNLMIDVGFFSFIKGETPRRVVFCIFELLLVCVFWGCMYIFAQKSRHRSRGTGEYYIMTGIVFAVYVAICYSLFTFLTQEQYSWLMRLTLNLCGLRFQTALPEACALYLLVFLAISIMIMLLEPAITETRHERMKKGRRRHSDSSDGTGDNLLDSFYKKKYERALRNYKKALHKVESREKHRH